MKPAFLLLPLLFAACAESPSPTASNGLRAADTGGEFDLVEADLASVHAALAGEQTLADGSTLSCERLTELHIERIFAHNDHPQANGGLPIRAVLHLNPAALDEAAALDAAYARDGGIGDRFLHCMPVLLKDNYDTFDHPSSSGSFAMLGHQAGVDAHAVAGLRAAGAVILGKANQDEFAFHTMGYSARAIQVANPYNTSESPGGSSSGTGAAIASSFAIGGTGTDTCASIRLPSSVNGLVGIRPSLGVVSGHGVFPLVKTRDAAGPMTRTVRDAALMLSAMAGVDPRDPHTLEFPPEARPAGYAQFLDREQHGVAGRNIGILRQLGSETGSAGSGAQGALIEAAAEKMREMGAHIYDVWLPDFTSVPAGSPHHDMNQYFAEFESEAGAAARRCLSSAAATETHGREVCTAAEGIIESARVGPRAAPIMGLVAVEDPDAAPSQTQLDRISAQRAYVTGVMDRLIDANLQPVRDADGERVRLDALLLAPGPTGGRTCELGSTTQMGSVVVPVGFDDGVGVPRGMEILVRRFDEGTAIGIAHDFEQATNHRRAPIIEASPLTGNETLAGFNARQQQALMTAGSAAPEDLPLETYQRALAELLGE